MTKWWNESGKRVFYFILVVGAPMWIPLLFILTRE